MDPHDVDRLLEMRFSIASDWPVGPHRDIALRAVDDVLRGSADEHLGHRQKPLFHREK
jgi:hypothetical protein